MILVSRLDAAPPLTGDGLELNVLSAVLLCGVAFGGGRDSLIGVIAGVLFVGLLNNGLFLFGVEPFWFRVSAGAALVVAASLDAIGRRLEGRSTRRAGRARRSGSDPFPGDGPYPAAGRLSGPDRKLPAYESTISTLRSSSRGRICLTATSAKCSVA